MKMLSIQIEVRKEGFSNRRENMMGLDRERNKKSGMPESMNVRPKGGRGVWRHSDPGVTINTALN